MVPRLRSLVRWASVPWRRPSLALALVVASAAPAFLLASADARRAAAGDRLADRLVAELDPSGVGVTVTSAATFDGLGVSERADVAIRAQLAAVGGLEPPVRTLYTPVGVADTGDVSQPLGVPIRLLARPGSVADLATADPAPSEDVGAVQEIDDRVWISAWLADRAGLTDGDMIRVAQPPAPEQPGAEAAPALGGSEVGSGVLELTVAGTYPTPWTPFDDPPEGYWRDVPPLLVPRYIHPFREPNFELLIVAEPMLATSGAAGWARWDAPRAERPLGVEAVREAVERYDELDLALVGTGELAAALSAQGGATPPAPQLVTSLPEALDRADALIAALGQPLAATRFAGAVVGLAVMMAGAAFLVIEREAEYRILAADGDRWFRFASRAALQLVAPSLAGLVAGVAAALAATGSAGTLDGASLDQVDLSMVVAVVAIGVVLAAGTVGVLGPATLAEPPLGQRAGSRLLGIGAGLVVLAAFLWRQVGQPPADRAAVDPAVISLPVVAVGAAVTVTLAALSPLVQRLGSRARTLPPVLYLGWRRIGDQRGGGRVLVAVLAVGLGLVAVATTTARALDRGVEWKVATELGAETQVALLGPWPDDVELPPTTTVAATDTTRVTPTDRRVVIVAVDPDTFATAVAWSDPDLSPDRVAALLDSDADGDLPVVGIDGQGLPTVGAFGIRRSFPYRMVARASSLPLATDSGPTLLVSADRLDRFERDRLARAMGLPSTSPEVDAAYVAPSRRMSQRLLSALPAAELETRLDDEQVRRREVLSMAARLDDVDVLAPRVAFDQLELVGLVASAAALAALALYLDARRRRRRLASLLLRHMGLDPRSVAAVTMVEVMAVTLVAQVVALVVAPSVVGRLVDRFDPAPSRPPELGAGLDWPAVAALGIGAIVAIGAVVWAGEYVASRRDDAGAVRGGG